MDISTNDDGCLHQHHVTLILQDFRHFGAEKLQVGKREDTTFFESLYEGIEFGFMGVGFHFNYYEV